MNRCRRRCIVYLRAFAFGLALTAETAVPLHAAVPMQKVGVPATEIAPPAARIGVPTGPAPTIAPFTADTAAPAKRQGLVSAGGLNWQCQGARCMASGASALFNLASCQALAREAGPIRSFTSAKQTLSAPELSRCNLGIGSGTGVGIAPLVAPLAGLPSVSNPSPSGGGAPAQTSSLARAQGPKGAGPTALSTGGGLMPSPLQTVPPVAAGMTHRTVINAATLRYAGRGAVVIHAGTLRYVGRGAVMINAGTLRYVGPVKGTMGHSGATTGGPQLLGPAPGTPAILPPGTPLTAGAVRGPVMINAGTLHYAGRGPVVINAATLRYAGRGPVVIRAETLRYSGASR